MRMGVLCVICVVVTSSLECVAVERVCQAHVCSHERLLWVDSGAVPGCWSYAQGRSGSTALGAIWLSSELL
jgi:hypothetical protein